MVDIPGCLCYHILCWDSEVSIGKPMAEHRNRRTCVRCRIPLDAAGENPWRTRRREDGAHAHIVCHWQNAGKAGLCAMMSKPEDLPGGPRDSCGVQRIPQGPVWVPLFGAFVPDRPP